MRGSSEILGDLDEILGDDGYEETVGADPGAVLAMARNRYRVGSRTVATQQATKGRTLVIPVDSVATVAASGTLAITTRPQVLFRAERFIAGDTTNFLINDIKIGKNSQFAASGSLPSSVFGAGAFGVRLKMDTCQVAMDIVVNVTNTDAGAAHRFNGAFIGASVE